MTPNSIPPGLTHFSGSIWVNTQSASRIVPDSKIHVANMGPTWGRQDPGGLHVGHTSLAIWDISISQVMIY